MRHRFRSHFFSLFQLSLSLYIYIHAHTTTNVSFYSIPTIYTTSQSISLNQDSRTETDSQRSGGIMGACLSADYSIHKSTANHAFVISVKGQLSQYPTPVFVSEVLLLQSSSFFLCNSDKLYYDHFITALDSEDQLDAGQIYFILPKTMLGTRLTASHMASLAVKASVALDHSNTTSRSRPQKRKKTTNNGRNRVSPMVLMETSQVSVVVEEKDDDMDGFGVGVGVSRWGSIRKMRRHSSKKGRRGVGSFRFRLSTIYENEGNCDDEQLAIA